MSSFGISGDGFILNNRPFRVLSGAIHYFRVHPDYWTDRIHKAKLMGLNTIETYVPWNLHEPKPGAWDISGWLDLGAFLTAVADEGMYAIVRPGPYICAEWDNGGLPAWLFTNPHVGIRRNEARFMEAVTRYLQRIYDVVAPLQITHGGPVILVQIENEYGAYGNDKSYLRQLVAVTRSAEIDVPLTTVDQPEDDMLENGSLPGLLKTGSFGSRSIERLKTLRRHQTSGPLMCSEFWNGWFDHWGAHHHTTSVEHSASELDDLLSLGASVNLYMFHGGTNFGFTNGANDKGVYQSLVTSYDYDAPLDEAGNPTDKYWAFRDVIAKYSSVPDESPQAAPAAPEIVISLTEAVPLLSIANQLGHWTWRDDMPTLDELGHFNGFALYATEIDESEPAVLEFSEIRDHATVFMNGNKIGSMARDHHEKVITIPPGRGTLTILIEDQGRVNYGTRLGEPKGLIGPARLNGEEHGNWGILPLQLNPLGAVSYENGHQLEGCKGLTGPVFARGTFSVNAPKDLFLDTSSWGKGVVWINVFCLGRYWSRGPQRTLYVPGPIINAGENEIVVLENGTASTTTVRFVKRADLGHTDE